MTAPHSDRDHSGDPFAMPFWPPAHRHAIETGQQQSDEATSLRRWKAEATEVILGLQDLGKALGLGLGERITGTSATEAAQRLTARAESAEAEVERLSETVARVEALREEIRAEQNRCCAYGTTHGDGRTCDCKFPFPGRTNSEATGCPERRRFIDQIDRALSAVLGAK